MDLLEPGTNIFKLVGPALMKQDLEESKDVVNKRLEYINEEMLVVFFEMKKIILYFFRVRCEKGLEDTDKKLIAARQAADTATKELQACVTQAK